MEDAEKLVEAARMIQKHCKKSCPGKSCVFSKISEKRCAGSDWCFLTGKVREWKIPNLRRWTDADVALAKALHAVGFVSVFKAIYSCTILAKRDRGAGWEVPTGLFENIKPGEIIQLSDIIAEGEKQ